MLSKLKLQNNSHDRRILINARNATGRKNAYSKYYFKKIISSGKLYFSKLENKEFCNLNDFT